MSYLKPKQRRAFTLMELAVALAIMGIVGGAVTMAGGLIITLTSEARREATSIPKVKTFVDAITRQIENAGGGGIPAHAAVQVFSDSMNELVTPGTTTTLPSGADRITIISAVAMGMTIRAFPNGSSNLEVTAPGCATPFVFDVNNNLNLAAVNTHLALVSNDGVVRLVTPSSAVPVGGPGGRCSIQVSDFSDARYWTQGANHWGVTKTRPNNRFEDGVAVPVRVRSYDALPTGPSNPGEVQLLFHGRPPPGAADQLPYIDGVWEFRLCPTDVRRDVVVSVTAGVKAFQDNNNKEHIGRATIFGPGPSPPACVANDTPVAKAQQHLKRLTVRTRAGFGRD
jgi:prepilin-type N-terminal cleavage/methylation domain-containing protein